MSEYKYVVTLDLKNASEGMLTKDEFFEIHLQREMLSKMIWGIGETEIQAINDAVRNLKNECVLQSYTCDDDVYEFVGNHGGREATRNMWINEEKEKIYLLPNHDALADFCERYNLPKAARRELAVFFFFFLYPDEEIDPRYIPNNPLK